MGAVGELVWSYSSARARRTAELSSELQRPEGNEVPWKSFRENSERLRFALQHNHSDHSVECRLGGDCDKLALDKIRIIQANKLVPVKGEKHVHSRNAKEVDQ